MNINDFAKSNAAALYLDSSAARRANSSAVTAGVQAGLTKADKRIQAQVDSTTAQLSSFGKLQSAVADTQAAAQALGSLKSTATAADQKAALGALVTAFNKAISASKSTATAVGSSATAQSASRVSQDLQRALGGSGSTGDSLKKVGLALGADGTLSLDNSQFDTARKADAGGLATGLGQLGKQLGSAAGQELASTGNVGSSLSSLTQRSSSLKGQQQMLAALQQPTTDNTADSTGSGAGSTIYDYGWMAFLKR